MLHLKIVVGCVITYFKTVKELVKNKIKSKAVVGRVIIYLKAVTGVLKFIVFCFLKAVVGACYNLFESCHRVC